MAGWCCQPQHCSIWHLVGHCGQGHARMNITCSSIPCCASAMYVRKATLTFFVQLRRVAPAHSVVVYHRHFVHCCDEHCIACQCLASWRAVWFYLCASAQVASGADGCAAQCLCSACGSHTDAAVVLHTACILCCSPPAGRMCTL
jgi:hypothetical protein